MVTSRNLVTKANAKDFLVHRVQFVNELEKLKNPRVVGMGIVAASGDDKPVVEREVVVGRKVSLHHLVEVPPLSLLRQHSPEDPVTTSVHLQQVLRILTAHQQRIPLLSDLTHLVSFLWWTDRHNYLSHSPLLFKGFSSQIVHLLIFYYQNTLYTSPYLLSSNYDIIHFLSSLFSLYTNNYFSFLFLSFPTLNSSFQFITQYLSFQGFFLFFFLFVKVIFQFYFTIFNIIISVYYFLKAN